MKLKIYLTLFLGLLFPLVTFSQLGGDFKSEKEDDNEIIEGDWVTQFKMPTYPSNQWTVFTVYSSFSSSGELVTTTIRTMYLRSPIGAPLKNEMPPERLVNSYEYKSKGNGYGELLVFNDWGVLTEKGEIRIDSPNEYRYRATFSSSGADLKNYPILTYTRTQSPYFKGNQKPKVNQQRTNKRTDRSDKIKKQAGAAFCCGGTGKLACADCSGNGKKMVFTQKSKTIWNPDTKQYESKLVDVSEHQNCTMCNGNGRVSCPTPTRCKQGKTGF